MLRELKETLNHIWNRLRRTESWIYGMSQMPLIVEERSTTTFSSTNCMAFCHYRKWSNGIVECWGDTYAKDYVMSAASGNGYYTTETIAWPTGLFKSMHSVLVGREQGTSGTPGNTLVTINMSQYDTTRCICYVQTTGSYTQSLSITFYAVGAWKSVSYTPQNFIDLLYDAHAWDYNYLDNLPTLNNKVISGNKTLADYGFTGEIANDKVGYTTTVPTADNVDGLKFVVLDQEPDTKYDGWIYLIKE